MRSFGYLLLVCAAACSGSSKATSAAPCPAKIAVGQVIECTCSTGARGTQMCQTDSTLSTCDCGAGTAADGGGLAHGGSGSGGGGQAGGPTGTGGTLAHDAGSSQPDGSRDTGRTDTDAAVDAGSKHPLTDGRAGAACDVRWPCMSGLTCNKPNAAIVGICTKACGPVSSCMALGAQFTCSGGNGALSSGTCEIACKGTGDKSCPDHMSCLDTNSTGVGAAAHYQCVYDPKSVGSGDVAIWQACDVAGDCKGDLLCFGRGTMMVAGTTYQGFCTQSCNANTDCKEHPPSGDITPTCGMDDKCQLACGNGGNCPQGMSCIADIAIGAQRCIYMK